MAAVPTSQHAASEGPAAMPIQMAILHSFAVTGPNMPSASTVRMTKENLAAFP